MDRKFKYCTQLGQNGIILKATIHKNNFFLNTKYLPRKNNYQTENEIIVKPSVAVVIKTTRNVIGPGHNHYANLQKAVKNKL